MNVVALALFIAAAVVFVIAVVAKPYTTQLSAAAGALLTVGFIIQFGAKSHSISF